MAKASNQIEKLQLISKKVNSLWIIKAKIAAANIYIIMLILSLR